MPGSVSDETALLHHLPADRVGVVQHLERIDVGLSGASVHLVTTSRGAYVLRIQSGTLDDADFALQMRILRRAAEAGIAPAVVHVDDAARAVVSVRVPGVPAAVAAANPGQRERVFASIVDRLRVLHALDASDVAERNPVTYARAAWESARERPGFPRWAAALAPVFDALEATLGRDPRRGVNHNDVNPVNVLWDGERAWLVDWDAAGLGHPYFDLATLAVFYRIDDAQAFELARLHDGVPPDDRARETFRALRRLAALLCGVTFLGLVDDLAVRPAPSVSDVPSLEAVYAALRAGELDLKTARGRASFGLALLAQGVWSEEPF
jgi:aminoglycoside phosphotransferase (APT) family kinase protein